MRRILVLAAVVVAIVVVAIGAFALRYQQFADTPLIPADGAEQRLTVEPGSSFRHVVNELAGRGLLEQPFFYRLMARFTGQAAAIKAGEYIIEPGTHPQAFLEELVEGDVVQYSLTVVEGWTFRQMMDALLAHDAIKRTLDDVSNEAVMAAIGHPEEHPEGRFYPDTYQFPRGTTDVDFLKRAYGEMARRLETVWAERQEDLPIDTPYEALILASIIERETAVPNERRRIAGVFVRRLERGMRLQTDPTVIYGMGDDFDGNIRRKDLRTDTPYNTYTRGGLPPTPIALPSQASLEAAVDPAEGEALYFVSKGDGSHKFSATLEEHNRAVRRYQLGQ